MTFMLTEEERKAVDALKRFANLRPIESEAQVQRCFIDLVDFERPPPQDGRRWITTNLVNHYADVQATVRGWLRRIAVTESKPGRRKAAATVDAEVTPEVMARVRPAFTLIKGRPKLVYSFGNVESVCAFALSLIADKDRGLTSRLHQCVCGRFNLELETKGRPPRYCPGHKALADAKTASKRSQKSRAKKLQEKKS